MNKIVQILNKGSLEICSRLNYDEELSKPQLGFYCNYRTCQDKHFAIVHRKEKLKCEVTRRPYDMSSERKLWFQDCSSGIHYTMYVIHTQCNAYYSDRSSSDSVIVVFFLHNLNNLYYCTGVYVEYFTYSSAT